MQPIDDELFELLMASRNRSYSVRLVPGYSWQVRLDKKGRLHLTRAPELAILKPQGATGIGADAGNAL